MSAKTSVDAIRRVIAAVQLENVRLAESSCWARIRSAAEVERAQLSFNRNAQVVERTPGGFIVAATGEATVAPGDEAAPVVSIKATFELFYRLPEGFEASQEELSSFASLNSVFNAWPYWREHIQRTSSQMNLPPIVLPVFRVAAGKPVHKKARHREKSKAKPN